MKRKVLFAAYGGGHVAMVLPVARALQDGGRADVQVLGLTTAAQRVRDAGLPLLQVKDFLGPGDDAALAHGKRLAAGLGTVVDPDESAAYLGLSYGELEAQVGAAEAAARYARDGRHAFLPRRLLERILRAVQPDLVVATNSPRAERAAIEAAGALGLPAVCLVDLFAIDEVRWIRQPGYGRRVCVLNEAVRASLLEAGRRPDEVVVTGNPAFDALQDPAVREQGTRLRQAQGWEGRRVLLWPTQVEPPLHPFDGTPADPTLPARALSAVAAWTLAQPDAVLCVRARAGEAPPALPADPRIVLTGQDWPLAPLLHAVDLVVTLTSTVGLEGHLCGTRLVQVLGSVFDAAMPLARYGIADAAVPLRDLPAALELFSRAGRREVADGGARATERVVSVLNAFL